MIFIIYDTNELGERGNCIGKVETDATSITEFFEQFVQHIKLIEDGRLLQISGFLFDVIEETK